MDFYIDETVYTGSPEDMSGRLPREVRTYALLDTLGIPFTRVDHDATATIDEMCIRDSHNALLSVTGQYGHSADCPDTPLRGSKS